MIDTTVEGNPQSVRTAGTFLGTTVKGKVEDAGDDAQAGRSKALGSWEGDASTAYRGFGRKLVEASDEQVDHLREAKQKFDAHAGKLERTQTRMSTRRGEASGVGLVVNGNTIERPADAVAPAEPGDGATAEQGAQYTADNTAYEAQVTKVETYNRLHGEVAEDHESLEQWIHDNLDTFWSEVDGPSAATVLVDVLQKPPPALTGALLSVRAGDLRQRAAESRAESTRLREDVQQARNSRRSGNPARRAAGEAVDVRGNRTTARALDALGEGGETVDEGLEDFGEGVADVASDVGDAVTFWN